MSHDPRNSVSLENFAGFATLLWTEFRALVCESEGRLSDEREDNLRLVA